MDTSPEEESAPASSVLISTFVVVNIIWWMVMIAGIGLGTIHLNHCPVQPNIPIFLIVLGACTLLALSLTYTRMKRGEGIVSIVNLLLSLLYVFTFSWFIAGTTWVYSVYPPSYAPGLPQYCHKITFQFAFVVTTLTWVFVMLLFFCFCGFAALICCNTLRARRLLIPSRHTHYGATSDYDQPIAGDV